MKNMFMPKVNSKVRLNETSLRHFETSKYLV